jgi:2-iminoacetate synthase ThiH
MSPNPTRLLNLDRPYLESFVSNHEYTAFKVRSIGKITLIFGADKLGIINGVIR